MFVKIKRMDTSPSREAPEKAPAIASIDGSNTGDDGELLYENGYGLRVIRVQKDLLTVPATYSIAFLTSADAKMRGPLEQRIKEFFPAIVTEIEDVYEDEDEFYPEVVIYRNVIALAVKERARDRVSLDNFERIIDELSFLITCTGLTHLAIPVFGNGGNKLDFNIVLEFLTRGLADSGLKELLICEYEPT